MLESRDEAEVEVGVHGPDIPDVRQRGCDGSPSIPDLRPPTRSLSLISYVTYLSILTNHRGDNNTRKKPKYLVVSPETINFAGDKTLVIFK